jgi:ribose 5-phosphate isomerase RpiB
MFGKRYDRSVLESARSFAVLKGASGPGMSWMVKKMKDVRNRFTNLIGYSSDFYG